MILVVSCAVLDMMPQGLIGVKVHKQASSGKELRLLGSRILSEGNGGLHITQKLGWVCAYCSQDKQKFGEFNKQFSFQKMPCSLSEYIILIKQGSFLQNKTSNIKAVAIPIGF